jgi:large subunit ribosomal protein L3
MCPKNRNKIMLGLLGKKIGMTQVFTDAGERVSVTVLEAGPCAILAIGAKSIQLGFEAIAQRKVSKPMAGYFKKLNVEPKRMIREVPRDPSRECKVGEDIKADLFEAGDYVDVSGVSIGKGFAGGMKRWHWKGGPETHGSTSHRRVGSIGSTTTPGRVWKGHHLPGHMGARSSTVQNLLVVKSDAQNNLLLVKGAVPGHKNAYVVIRKAIKKKAKKTPQAQKAQAKK